MYLRPTAHTTSSKPATRRINQDIPFSLYQKGNGVVPDEMIFIRVVPDNNKKCRWIITSLSDSRNDSS
ncbi:hypothetical protein XBJ2_1830017 [Xenorhabdus bovienii str. Jollieti]|nr:hypothetical protein XBJ2_1830017 [Xenorhabdus bovienii str. Jollieti]